MASLSDRLQDIFSKLKGKARLSEADVTEALREVRVALLEADVNYKVAKDFVASIKSRAIGSEVLESLTPGQQVVKIVNEEMMALMGGDQAKLAVSSKPPTVILMAGLQGPGKTTSAGKIALYLKGQGKRPLLAAGDIYRPAAIRQLEILGEKNNIPVFSLGDQVNPIKIATEALAHARQHGNDYLIVDTAGRLQIDEDMMKEIEAVAEAVNPTETLLVVDAMAGQDAVNAAKVFDERLPVTGIVLTKLDGDTRGGAALSVKAVTGKPIKFTGTGEKVEALEPFYPDRMASRILGMGDMLSLIERAQSSLDQEKVIAMEQRLRQSKFTFDDYMEQLQQIKKMGDTNELLSMVPGMGKQLKNIQVDDKQFARAEAIIQSMTKGERTNSAIINASRKQRISRGSGQSVQEVNRLLKQFDQMQKLIKQVNSMSQGKKKGKMPFGMPF